MSTTKSDTTIAHHPDCPMEMYWDVRQEAGAYCTCPRFWPRSVCVECWQSPKRHAKRCSHFQSSVKNLSHEEVA